MQCLGEGLGELRVGDRSGSGEVDGPGDGVVGEDLHHGRDVVVQADPRQVLPAVTDLAAQPELEQRSLLAEESTGGADDQPGAQRRHAYPLGCGRGGFLPAAAHLCQESGTGPVVLVEPPVTAVRAVEAHRRTTEEDPAAR